MNLVSVLGTADVSMLLQEHKDKTLHGVYYKHLEGHGLSKERTCSSLGLRGKESDRERE